jgi:hypothetical protein
MFKCEQTLRAYSAVVHSDIIVPPVFIRKRPLSAVLLCYPISMGCEDGLQVFATNIKSVVHPSCILLDTLPLPRLAFFRLKDIMHDAFAFVVIIHSHVVQLVIDGQN